MRSTSAGSPETWSACTCVSKTATIGAPIARGGREVVVDEVGVRVDDRELRVRRAAEQVAGTRGRRRSGRVAAASGSPLSASSRPAVPARRHSGKPTSSRRASQAARAQQPHGVVGVDAVRPAAVRDDLAPPRQPRQRARRARRQRRRARAGDVPGPVLGLRPHVEHHDVAARQPIRRARRPTPARCRPGRPGTRRRARVTSATCRTATSRTAAHSSPTRSLASR